MADPIIVRTGRAIAVRRIIFWGAIAAVVAFFYFESGGGAPVLFTGVTILSLFIIIRAAPRLFDRRVRLVLHDEGLEIPGHVEGIIPWSEIDHVDTHSLGYSTELHVRMRSHEPDIEIPDDEYDERPLPPADVYLIGEVDMDRDDLLREMRDRITDADPEFPPFTEQHDLDGFSSETPHQHEVSQFFGVTQEQYLEKLNEILAIWRANHYRIEAGELEQLHEDGDTLFESLTLVTHYLFHQADQSRLSLVRPQAEFLRAKLEDSGWDMEDGRAIREGRYYHRSD